MTKENQRKLERTETMMIRKMCGGREGVPVEKIRQEMGIMGNRYFNRIFHLS